MAIPQCYKPEADKKDHGPYCPVFRFQIHLIQAEKKGSHLHEPFKDRWQHQSGNNSGVDDLLNGSVFENKVRDGAAVLLN
jgi:hypothetical protein